VARHHQQTAPDTPDGWTSGSGRPGRRPPRPDAPSASSRCRSRWPSTPSCSSRSWSATASGTPDSTAMTGFESPPTDQETGSGCTCATAAGRGVGRRSRGPSARPLARSRDGGCTWWIAWPAGGAPPRAGTGSSSEATSPTRASSREDPPRSPPPPESPAAWLPRRSGRIRRPPAPRRPARGRERPRTGAGRPRTDSYSAIVMASTRSHSRRPHSHTIRT
jgi:hypothetical protein